MVYILEIILKHRATEQQRTAKIKISFFGKSLKSKKYFTFFSPDFTIFLRCSVALCFKYAFTPFS